MKCWYGKLLGFMVGLYLLRHPFAALVGMSFGHILDTTLFCRKTTTKPYKSGKNNDDPYRILGLTEGATDAEINMAWRRLIAKYHPDRVAQHANQVLSDQAGKLTCRANNAYDEIRKQRKHRPHD